MTIEHGSPIDALAIRKNELVASISQNYRVIQTTREETSLKEAQLLQIVMLELASEHPEIATFNFTAESEYDDEGGYFYSPTFHVDFRDGHHESEYDAYDENYWFSLRESGGLNENALCLAFESDDQWGGSITVERIRAIFAGESRSVTNA